MKTALYPGTFDPITNGHLDILERARKLFDHIIVAIAENEEKDPTFPLEERKRLVEENLIHLFAGNLPLYKSYWLYYVFGNFVISVPLLMISKSFIGSYIFSFSLYLLINLSYYCISCVGVWRSSHSYKKNKILAFLARLIVVLGISTTLFELKNILEIIYY